MVDLSLRCARTALVALLLFAVGVMVGCQGMFAGGTASKAVPGALTVIPSNINFGSVQVGSSQTRSAAITNTGGTSVTVTNESAPAAGFSVAGLTLPFVLAPGQSSAFTVTFAPQASGNVSASLAFLGDTATLSLPLAGSGLMTAGLTANPSSVSFGNVPIGNTQVQTITLTNGGSTSVTISQLFSAGSGFGLSGISVPFTLAAGQTVSFSVTFTPNSGGASSGSLSITSTASNSSLTVPLSGSATNAGSLAANPISVTFGAVQVGSTQSHSETLTNNGGSPVQISTATVAGTGFAISGLILPTSLAAGQSVTFNLTFTPSSAGGAVGSLTVTANGAVLNIALSGTGASAGQLALTPSTVNFGNVVVGASQSQTETLTVSGAGVTITSASSSNAEFALSGLSLPVSLSAGQSASFTARFAPQASGTTSGTITFVSNATNGPVAESVAGTGIAPPQHTVSLSWTASTSTVVGYNVYRGTQSGGPYAAVTTAPDAGTTYTDNTVQAGATYYYVVTAVSATGTESVYSNQAQAVIPNP
jgi:Cep192 domain 4/Abnormal spindle-like microcephaly-assoc'd, ASPM-SPD-2-Hydin